MQSARHSSRHGACFIPPLSLQTLSRVRAYRTEQTDLSKTTFFSLLSVLARQEAIYSADEWRITLEHNAAELTALINPAWHSWPAHRVSMSTKTYVFILRATMNSSCYLKSSLSCISGARRTIVLEHRYVRLNLLCWISEKQSTESLGGKSSRWDLIFDFFLTFPLCLMLVNIPVRVHL